MREHELTILGRKPEAWDKARLTEILDREITKEVPDDELVLAVLGELKRRDADKPVELTGGQKKIWKAHKRKIRKRAERSLHILHPMVRAAVVVLALCALVLVVPQSGNAESLWKIVASWTADIFRYENIGGGTEAAEEAGFQTNHGDCRRCMMPWRSWGSSRGRCRSGCRRGMCWRGLRKKDTPAQRGVNAGFSDGEREIVLDVREMDKDLSPDYYKEDTEVVEYECNGVFYNMIENTGNWTVNWTVHNLKCFISVDCQEDVVKQIIKSIN